MNLLLHFLMVAEAFEQLPLLHRLGLEAIEEGEGEGEVQQREAW